jgi:iron(III) transport system substrate-binding protein
VTLARRTAGAGPSGLTPVRGLRLLRTLALVVVAACAGETADEGGGHRQGASADGPLVVYSGRAEGLVGPLLKRFGDEAGVAVEVRYDDTSVLTEALLAEGTRSPAAVFLAQDATALGALSRRGMLRDLPMDIVQRVPARFAATEQKHDWVGLTARARTVVFNRGVSSPEALPRGLAELGERRFHGRFGFAPATPSFAAHMAVFRVVGGEAALAGLLAAMRDNAARSFPDDGAVVRAVARGEIDWGLVDLPQALRHGGDRGGSQLGVHFMDAGEGSAFVNLSGAGLLTDDPRALELLRFLLGAEAQRHLSRQTGEYPLALDEPPAADLPPLASLRTPAVDFADLAAVAGETQAALRRSGLVR